MVNEREAALAIRQILDEHGKLDVAARLIRNGDDLFAHGLNCLAAVDVLLAIETAFGVVVPSSMMSRRSVASIDTLLTCVQQLQAKPIAA